MDIREWANRNPKAVAWIVGVLVVSAVGWIVYDLRSGRPGYPTKPPDSYYTDDDGKTYFVASSDHYAPFDHNGLPAVHAYVFQCGSTKFVGFLERYVSDVKQKLDAGSPLTAEMTRFGREIKRPGDTSWTRTGDMAKENAIENVPCPNGTGVPDEIEP